MRDRGPSWPARGAVAAVVALFGGAGVALGDTCPVPLFREYDPTRPPRILTDPPIRSITDTPYLDPDAAPAATALIFYKVNRQDGADPPYPSIRALKRGTQVELHWGGGGDARPCCIGATCSMLCPVGCLAGGGTVGAAGLACTSGPPPCEPTGACCDPASGVCFDAYTPARCQAECFCYLGDGTGCQLGCPATAACCDPFTFQCADDWPSCGRGTPCALGFSLGCGTTCSDPAVCVVGACCSPSRVCSDDVFGVDCGAPGFTFFQSEPCSRVTCP